jgi:hypothetical protein
MPFIGCNYHLLVNVILLDGTAMTNTVDIYRKAEIEDVVEKIINTGFDERLRWSHRVDHLEITSLVDRNWEPVKFVWGKRPRKKGTIPNFVHNQFGVKIDFAAAVILMDDDLREEIHQKLAPCSDQRFFNAYAKAHVQKFNELWELAKSRPVW